MNYKARKDGKEEEARRGCGRGEEDRERLVSQTLWISDELIHAAGALITQRCALCSLQNHPPSPELKRWLLSIRQGQVKLQLLSGRCLKASDDYHLTSSPPAKLQSSRTLPSSDSLTVILWRDAPVTTTTVYASSKISSTCNISESHGHLCIWLVDRLNSFRSTATIW